MVSRTGPTTRESAYATLDPTPKNLAQVQFEFNHFRSALLDTLGSLDDSAFATRYVPSTSAICAWHDKEHAATSALGASERASRGGLCEKSGVWT